MILEHTNKRKAVEELKVEVKEQKIENKTSKIPEIILQILTKNLENCLEKLQDDSWQNRKINTDVKDSFYASFNPITGQINVIIDNMDIMPLPSVQIELNLKTGLDRKKFRNQFINSKGSLSITAIKILFVMESIFSSSEVDLSDISIFKEKISHFRKNQDKIVSVWNYIDHPDISNRLNTEFLIGLAYAQSKLDRKWNPDWKATDLQMGVIVVVYRSKKPRLRFGRVQIADVDKLKEGNTQILIDLTPKVMFKDIEEKNLKKDILCRW